MTTGLRTSQVEVLRLAASLSPAEIEADFVAEQMSISFQAAWSEMRQLAAAGYLKDTRLAGYRLTQLGHEALEGRD